MAFNFFDKETREKISNESGEYFATFALAQNARIGEIDSQLQRQISGLKGILPEYTESQKNGTLNIKFIKLFNSYVHSLRHNLDQILIATGEHVKVKSIGNNVNSDKYVLKILNDSRKIVVQPLNKIDAWRLVDLAEKYHGILVIKGIVPIVAGYKEETGMGKFYRE